MNAKSLKFACIAVAAVSLVSQFQSQAKALDSYLSGSGTLVVWGDDADDIILFSIVTHATGTRANPGWTKYVKVEMSNNLGDETWRLYPLEDVREIWAAGWKGDDHIDNATDIPSRLTGGYGDDFLEGGSGDDDIHGGPGSDGIWGRDGDDYLHAGNAMHSHDWNILVGHGGADTFIYNEDDTLDFNIPASWYTPDENYFSGPNAGMSRRTEESE